MSGLTLLGVLLATAYLVSLKLHPYAKCPACDGGGKHTASLFSHAFRPCRSCGGSGRKLRLGAQILGIGRPR